MNISFAVLIGLAIISAIILIYGFIKSKHRFSSLISSSFFGFLGYLIMALTGNITGIYVGINLPSLILSLILGIPGVAFLIFMNLIK